MFWQWLIIILALTVAVGAVAVKCWHLIRKHTHRNETDCPPSAPSCSGCPISGACHKQQKVL